MTEDSAFMTADEVIDYLHINLRTLYRLIRLKELPAFRVGRQWRFLKKDLDAWLLRSRRSLQKDAPRRVLVVDDDAQVRKTLVENFHRAKYAVEEASDGASAIDCLRAAPYDLLVTDLQMPGMGGLAVIREVRRRSSSSELPILIITGRSTEASAIEAINLGVSGYFVKPFRYEMVLAVAARALGDPVPARTTH